MSKAEYSWRRANLFLEKDGHWFKSWSRALFYLCRKQNNELDPNIEMRIKIIITFLMKKKIKLKKIKLNYLLL